MSFLIRRADNLYDLCYGGGRKGLFLIVNQLNSPIIYCASRELATKTFLLETLKGRSVIGEDGETFISGELSEYQTSYLDKIYDALEKGEKGVFACIVNDSPQGYALYARCGDSFSSVLLNESIKKMENYGEELLF